MAILFENGHFGHYRLAQYGHKYGQLMTAYESIGNMKINGENGFEKCATSKKWEPKQIFVDSEAIFNVFWSSESLKIGSL